MEDIERMFYQERCEALSKNVALIARNFQYRVKVSFKIIVMNDSLEETQNIPIPVEFQVRGSLILAKLIELEYTTCIDNIIRADLPDLKTESKLWYLVQEYRIYRDSKHAGNIKIKVADFILVKFSQVKLSSQSLCPAKCQMI